MKQETKGYWDHGAELQGTCDVPAVETIKKEQEQTDIPVIIDHKVTLLAAAGAAITADCRPCLNDIMPELEEAGVSESDLRWAMENGQFSGINAELGTFALGQVYKEEDAKDVFVS
jgi:hypothetical protein